MSICEVIVSSVFMEQQTKYPSPRFQTQGFHYCFLRLSWIGCLKKHKNDTNILSLMKISQCRSYYLYFTKINNRFMLWGTLSCSFYSTAFSYTCWPFVCLLQKNICSSPLLIFLIKSMKFIENTCLFANYQDSDCLFLLFIYFIFKKFIEV